jgi:CheY-like chemotaxis protein
MLKAKKSQMLVVDDDAVVAEIHKMLFMRDYDVTVAANGQEAIRWLLKKTFQIILTDIDMPVMNGIDLAKNIRKLPNPNKKSIVIGATANKCWLDKTADMNAICAKPLCFSEVQHLIHDINVRL